MTNTLFNSSRLNFRRIERSDFDHIYNLHSNPQVMRYVDAERPATTAEVKSAIDRNIARYDEWKQFGLWAAEIRGSADFVGWFALKPLSGYPEIELGYRLMPEYWGMGLATEGGRRLLELGFCEFKLPKIVAITHPENLASQRVLKKLNFSPVGKKPFHSPITGVTSEVEFFEAFASFSV